MMVEQSRYVENVGSLHRDLQQATKELRAMSGNQMISKQDIQGLMSTLQHVNANLDPSFWADKKPAPTEMKVAIENALAAVALFPKVAPKNAEQAITSLFSSLNSTMKDFDKNLKNLKKYKIGRKVEKTSETEATKRDKENPS